MQDIDLFQLALGLSSTWMVTRSEFDAVDGRLDLYVIFRGGAGSSCVQCGREGCAVHDTKEETWRHLDFFQHRTLLHARTPRVTCPECGVRKVATPWARAGSGFTLLFETFMLTLAKAMPIANAASCSASTTRACGASSSIMSAGHPQSTMAAEADEARATGGKIVADIMAEGDSLVFIQEWSATPPDIADHP